MENQLFEFDVDPADTYDEGVLLNTLGLDRKDPLLPTLERTPPTTHPHLTPLEVLITRLEQIPEHLVELSSFGDDSAGFLCGHAFDAYGEEFDVSEEDAAIGNGVWVYKVFSKKGKGQIRTRKGKLACKIGVKIHRVGAYDTNNGLAQISYDSYGDLGIEY